MCQEIFEKEASRSNKHLQSEPLTLNIFELLQNNRNLPHCPFTIGLLNTNVFSTFQSRNENNK